MAVGTSGCGIGISGPLLGPLMVGGEGSTRERAAGAVGLVKVTEVGLAAVDGLLDKKHIQFKFRFAVLRGTPA